MKKIIFLLSLLIFSCQKKPQSKQAEISTEKEPIPTITIVKDSSYLEPRSKYMIKSKDSITELAIELHLDSKTERAWLRPRFYSSTRQTFSEYKDALRSALHKTFECIPAEYSVSFITSSFYDDYSVDWSIKIAQASSRSSEYQEFRKNYPNSKLKSINEILVNIINESRPLAPLQQLFQDLGYQLQLVHVEKVFSQKVEVLPFSKKIIMRGLKGKEQVIYDAGMYTFLLIPVDKR